MAVTKDHLSARAMSSFRKVILSFGWALSIGDSQNGAPCLVVGSEFAPLLVTGQTYPKSTRLPHCLERHAPRFSPSCGTTLNNAFRRAENAGPAVGFDQSTWP